MNNSIAVVPTIDQRNTQAINMQNQQTVIQSTTVQQYSSTNNQQINNRSSGVTFQGSPTNVTPVVAFQLPN
jgi:hypothetical protein